MYWSRQGTASTTAWKHVAVIYVSKGISSQHIEYIWVSNPLEWTFRLGRGECLPFFHFLLQADTMGCIKSILIGELTNGVEEKGSQQAAQTDQAHYVRDPTSTSKSTRVCGKRQSLCSTEVRIGSSNLRTPGGIKTLYSLLHKRLDWRFKCFWIRFLMKSTFKKLQFPY